MATTDFVSNAIWQLEVCNACRYCEGYCAVFPALERRRTFTVGDLDYLANLCYDCRACYYACMFAPPHEYGVNIPRTFSEVRRTLEQARRRSCPQWAAPIALLA